MASKEHNLTLEELTKWKSAEPPLYYVDHDTPTFVCLRNHSSKSMVKDGKVSVADNPGIMVPTKYLDVLRGYTDGSYFIVNVNWTENEDLFSHLTQDKEIIINSNNYKLKYDAKDISQRGHFLFLSNADGSRTKTVVELKEGVNLLAGIAAYLEAYVNYFEDSKLLIPKPRDILDYLLILFGNIEEIKDIKSSIKSVYYSNSMLDDLKKLMLPNSHETGLKYYLKPAIRRSQDDSLRPIYAHFGNNFKDDIFTFINNLKDLEKNTSLVDMLINAGIFMNEHSAMTESYIYDLSDKTWKSLQESVSPIEENIGQIPRNLIAELPADSSITEISNYSNNIIRIYDALLEGGLIYEGMNDQSNKDGLPDNKKSQKKDQKRLEVIKEDVELLRSITNLTKGMGNYVTDSFNIQTFKSNKFKDTRRHTEVANILLHDAAMLVNLLIKYENNISGKQDALNNTRSIRYQLEDTLSYIKYQNASDKEQYLNNLSQSRIAYIPLLAENVTKARNLLQDKKILSVSEFQTASDLSTHIYEVINSEITPKIKSLSIDYISDAVISALILDNLKTNKKPSESHKTATELKESYEKLVFILTDSEKPKDELAEIYKKVCSQISKFYSINIDTKIYHPSIRGEEDRVNAIITNTTNNVAADFKKGKPESVIGHENVIQMYDLGKYLEAKTGEVMNAKEGIHSVLNLINEVLISANDVYKNGYGGKIASLLISNTLEEIGYSLHKITD